MIIRLARENGRWGYGKIEGELLKLGFTVSVSTVRNALNRHGILPAPVRHGSIGWRHLMAHYKQQLLACDFFTVETIWLQTLYMLFFIKLGTRRVYLAGVTAHPDGRWVAQQARQMAWTLEEDGADIRFLLSSPPFVAAELWSSARKFMKKALNCWETCGVRYASSER